MIVLLIVKLLCDFSYYFLFANYFGSFSNIHYSLALTMAVLTAAGTLSGMLAKKGGLRLVPAAAAFALLLQVRSVADAVVLLPPLLYLWFLCYKQRYWPDVDEYKDAFAIQWKTLLVLPLFLLLTSDFAALQEHCLPLVVLFLATAVLSLRMMRHNPAVLSLPRFQIQNAVTVAVVALAAWALSSDAFFAAIGTVLSGIRMLLTPFLEVLIWGIANVVSWFMKLAVIIINWLRQAMGSNEQENPEIKIPENIKDELALEQETPPQSETFAQVITTLAVIALLIAAFFIFKKMLGRRKVKEDDSVFTPSGMSEPLEKRERETLLAPKDPRAAVRWHYRKFLRYCQNKNVPLTRFQNSAQINELAQRDGVAQRSDSDPLRDLYITARYSGNPVTEADAKEAKELVKRIKEKE